MELMLETLLTFVSPEDGHVDLSGDDTVTLAGITIGGPGIGKNLCEAPERETRRILTEHGPTAFEATKKAAAIQNTEG